MMAGLHSMDMQQGTFATPRSWKAKWIGSGDRHADWRAPSRPAPYFRKCFELRTVPADAKAFVCGLGYFELYINGRRVGDHVLDPAPTVYDRRARYLVFEVAALLRPGCNVIAAVLGNGWYNCQTAEVWHFDKAPWQDEPKLLCEVVSGGEVLAKTDSSWKCFRDGPIRENQLRNGEEYDAGLEMPGWNDDGFDDSRWQQAVIVPGPGGVLTEQRQPPCRVTRTVPPVASWTTSINSTIYDFGENLTGWVRVHARGKAGGRIEINYSELVSYDHLDQHNIEAGILSGKVQTDIITVGDGDLVREPSFTYHGFRYVQLFMSDGIELVGIEARMVNTDFRKKASFESSSPILDALFNCTAHTYLCNFTGIPTDCPHREKNGWTGDALMACRTGLALFDSASAYAHWLQTFRDCQRPNGQLPAIVPTGGWGYNRFSGPAWDSAFVLIPWQVYLHTGDNSAMEAQYDGIMRYLQYLEGVSEDHIVAIGLGDWCHWSMARICPPALTSTAFFHLDVATMARYSRMSGRLDAAARLDDLASRIRSAFMREFRNGDTDYGDGGMTALACAAYCGLAPQRCRKPLADRIAALSAARSHTADFGILGALFVPRVLAEYGHADTALKIITQTEKPGWGHWIEQGATTLHENWYSSASQNHVMFGDIAAWMIEYAAGLRPSPDAPGFAQITLSPAFGCGLGFVRASCLVPSGRLDIFWERTAGGWKIAIGVPTGLPASLVMPDASVHRLEDGVNDIEIAAVNP